MNPQPHLEISHSCLLAVPKARIATANRQVCNSCQHTIPLLTSFHRYCTNQCILSGFIKPIFVPSAIGCCAGQEGCYAVQMEAKSLRISPHPLARTVPLQLVLTRSFMWCFGGCGWPAVDQINGFRCSKCTSIKSAPASAPSTTPLDLAGNPNTRAALSGGGSPNQPNQKSCSMQ